MALPELYTDLLYISYDVCKHLVDIIEVLLISYYSQPYLSVFVSEQESRRSVVINGLIRGV